LTKIYVKLLCNFYNRSDLRRRGFLTNALPNSRMFKGVLDWI
jgi:hypothetical protein